MPPLLRGLATYCPAPRRDFSPLSPVPCGRSAFLLAGRSRAPPVPRRSAAAAHGCGTLLFLYPAHGFLSHGSIITPGSSGAYFPLGHLPFLSLLSIDHAPPLAGPINLSMPCLAFGLVITYVVDLLVFRSLPPLPCSLGLAKGRGYRWTNISPPNSLLFPRGECAALPRLLRVCLIATSGESAPFGDRPWLYLQRGCCRFPLAACS